MKSTNKYFVGHTLDHTKEAFTYKAIPTFETHGNTYLYVTGPFKTKRGSVVFANSQVFITQDMAERVGYAVAKYNALYNTK
jgi:hypothetical protein